MNKLRIIGLMLSFGLEVFSSQIIFIYIPLMLLFNGSGEVISSITRALAYIGPVLFGFYIGSCIDKNNKRASGFLVSLFLSIATLLLSFIDIVNNMYLTVFYLFFASISTYFLNNLRVTVLPLLIKEANLSNANSILLIIENVALLGAPALSALMLKISNPSSCIGLLSFSFFVSSLLYLFSLKGFKNTHGSRFKASFIESCQLLFTNKQFMVLVFAMMGSNAFVGVFSLYIMIHAYDSGIIANSETPFILIASGIGAIISGLLASKIIQNFDVNRIVIFCGLMLAFFGFTPLIFNYKISYYLSSFGEGFFSSWLVICVWTMRQKLVRKDVLGKVTGITSALFKLSMVISIPLSGIISSHYGSALSLASSSVWVLVFIAPVFIFNYRSGKSLKETT